MGKVQDFNNYQNRSIRLTSERLSHILEHPEMNGLESEIGVVLGEPQIVRQSRTDDQVQLYYRYYELTKVGGKWLCVVVKQLADDAFVITAYLTDKVKQGVELWPSV